MLPVFLHSCYLSLVPKMSLWVYFIGYILIIWPPQLHLACVATAITSLMFLLRMSSFLIQSTLVICSNLGSIFLWEEIWIFQLKELSHYFLLLYIDWWKCRLRVFENMILRRVFGPKNGEWRRLHNDELHSLYRSPNIVRVIKSRKLRWAGHVARMEKRGSAFKILTGKSTGKRPLGRQY